MPSVDDGARFRTYDPWVFKLSRFPSTEWVRLAIASNLVTFTSAAMVSLTFGYEHLGPWLLADAIFELMFTAAVYAVAPTLPAVIGLQLVLDFLIRSAGSLKVRELGTPIIPSDFYLLTDAAQIISPPLLWCGLALLTIVLAAVSAVVARRLRRPRLPSAFAMIPALIICGCLALSPETIAEAADLLTRNQVFGIPFLLKEKSATIGIPLAFVVDLSRFLTAQRHPPNRAEVAAALTDWGATHVPGPRPAPPAAAPRNVYVLLSESFWDPTAFLPAGDAYGNELFTEDYHRILREGGNKKFWSPRFGGGTANVEFEVLCGIPSAAVGRGIVFQTTLKNRLRCLPSILRDLGYRSFAFHPFDGGFYNRKVAFPAIGFDTFQSIRDFLPTAVQGDFLADRTFVAESLRRARAMAQGRPFLAYMMTFAGHWPYAWVPSEYQHRVHLHELNGPVVETLERELDINRSASDVLARTVREISANDPSAIVVMAGDHLPEIVGEIREQGREEELTEARLFETPLVLSGESVPATPELVAAYEILELILAALGQAEDKRGYLPWFRAPADIRVRPLHSGNLLIKGSRRENGAIKSVTCGWDDRTEPCELTTRWFRWIRTLARDLVSGKQYSLSPGLAPR